MIDKNFFLWQYFFCITCDNFKSYFFKNSQTGQDFDNSNNFLALERFYKIKNGNLQNPN
jgi:hypothetical protein